MSWNKRGLKIQLDTCTYCNAKCPMCDRTDINGLGKRSDLPLIQWTLDDFKKAFSPEDLKSIDHISFCPTHGDAIMSNYTKSMIEYVFEHNPICSVSVDTNGSIRDENWWWEFGLISKGGRYDLKVNFAIDGITQEMHEKYRQGTNLQKILNNMKAFAETKSKIYVQTIVFKHNQPYLKEIENLVKQYGATTHQHTYTDRSFPGKNKFFNFTDENGISQNLEKANEPINNKNYQKRILELTENITCSWNKVNRISISYDGQVHPCCFFSNPYDKKSQWFLNHPLIKSYMNYKDELNIFNYSLSEIISHKWFNDELPNNWINKTPVNQCIKHCSNERILFRDYIPITPV